MTACPRHDDGRNWVATNSTAKAPCGCLVHTTTVRQVTGRPTLAPPQPPAEPPSATRCGAPRPTSPEKGTCYHPAGHPGPHSWEKQ